jgi:hypothetical protein
VGSVGFEVVEFRRAGTTLADEFQVGHANGSVAFVFPEKSINILVMLGLNRRYHRMLRFSFTFLLFSFLSPLYSNEKPNISSSWRMTWAMGTLAATVPRH